MASNNLPWILPLFLAISFSVWPSVQAIGVNWGTEASHPLPPSKVVELLKANNISKVKLFDTNPEMLESLSGYNIDVTVGIPNSMLRSLNSSLKTAESWVHDNLTRYFSDGASRFRIEYIAIGDEPFNQIYGDQFFPFVVGAAENIQTALTKAKLAGRVKLVVPCSSDAFQSESCTPLKGHFRADVNGTIAELLKFLSKHQSPFFVNISPFLSYHSNKNISLDFALFKETTRPHNDSCRTYRSSFDLSYDTLVSALSSAGFDKMDIVISQIGWPTDGAANATSSNAQVFMKGLIEHLRSRAGTPLRPNKPPIETYIYSLFDEDHRSIASGNFERHWGVFTFDGQAKFQLNLGQGSRKLVDAQNVQYLSSKWCVVNNNQNLSNATARALEACSSADCSVLSPGGSCFNLSWPGNISYAFNSNYQQHDQMADSCDFGGLGLITTVDPSEGTCRFTVQLRMPNSAPFQRFTISHWRITVAIILLWLVGGGF
ncbi:unnamed protein product [Withania somnifera]